MADLAGYGNWYIFQRELGWANDDNIFWMCLVSSTFLAMISRCNDEFFDSSDPNRSVVLLLLKIECRSATRVKRCSCFLWYYLMVMVD